MSEKLCNLSTMAMFPVNCLFVFCFVFFLVKKEITFIAIAFWNTLSNNSCACKFIN